MRGQGTHVIDPVLEHTIIEFQLARNCNILPSELRRLSTHKVQLFYALMKEVMKKEAEEIRKAS